MEDTSSLKRSVLSAVGWASGTRMLGQLVNWAMTLATIRFLNPHDYGLMAITMAVNSFLQAVSWVGFANVIVQSRRIGDEDMRGVFGLILMSNAAGLVALCALAPLAAWFYGEPRLATLLQVVSLTFIATALQAIPRAKLEKKLDLKTVSRVDMLSNIVGGIVVLVLAWRGAGVWSLITGAVLNASLRTAGLNMAEPYFRRPRFTFRNLSEVLHFGGLRTAENLLWSVYTNADAFIIGKLLGPHVLGIYSVSRYVAALPIEKLALVLNPVAFPAFARLQDDRLEALRYLKKAIRLLAVVCLPIFFGMAATAPQIVAVALGPKWSEATTPLAILAFGMALRPIGLIIPSFLFGIGEFVASFKNTLFATILFPVAFIVGSHWGLIGVCSAWLVAYPLQLLSLVRRVALITNTPIIGLLQPLLSPLAASLIMYIAVRAAAAMLPSNVGVWGNILWLVATGAVVYLGYAALFLRPVAAELVSLVRR